MARRGLPPEKGATEALVETPVSAGTLVSLRSTAADISFSFAAVVIISLIFSFCCRFSFDKPLIFGVLQFISDSFPSRFLSIVCLFFVEKTAFLPGFTSLSGYFLPFCPLFSAMFSSAFCGSTTHFVLSCTGEKQLSVTVNKPKSVTIFII